MDSDSLALKSLASVTPGHFVVVFMGWMRFYGLRVSLPDGNDPRAAVMVFKPEGQTRPTIFPDSPTDEPLQCLDLGQSVIQVTADELLTRPSDDSRSDLVITPQGPAMYAYPQRGIAASLWLISTGTRIAIPNNVERIARWSIGLRQGQQFESLVEFGAAPAENLS